MEGYIYTGHDLSAGAHLTLAEVVEFNQREDALQDYAWRALGDHIGRGPSDCPQRVEMLLLTRKGPMRVRADLSIVPVDEHGEPTGDEQVPMRVHRSYRPGLQAALSAALAALQDAGRAAEDEHVERLRWLAGALSPDHPAPQSGTTQEG